MIDATTQTALRARKTGSQCQLARELQISVGTISDILAGRHNHVSLHSENRVRLALGLPFKREPIELAPDERLLKAKPVEQRDKRRCLHASPELWQRLRQQRGALSEEQFLKQLADLWDQTNGELHAEKENTARNAGRIIYDAVRIDSRCP